MGKVVQMKGKISKNSDLETTLNDKMSVLKFFRYSIKNDMGVGLIYELVCYTIKLSENLQRIGTLYINLIGPGERARITVNLDERLDEDKRKKLDITFNGPIYRYLNLENKILLELLKKKIYEICTKNIFEDQGKISLIFLYKNNKINCAYSNEKHKQDIQELTTYIGCALKSKELSELIYYRFNLNSCKEESNLTSDKRNVYKRSSTIYII